MTSVALCPIEDEISPFAASVTVTPQPFVVPAPVPGSRWVSHVAAHLASTAEPLILVLTGRTAAHAPALGFSRRSLRRPAVGYVLVDPAMPEISADYGDWPDAPVTIVMSENAPDFAKEAALQARLRGWTITKDSLNDVLNQLLA